MSLRSFQMRNFRILHGPQHGTYSDEEGIGVSSPSELRQDVHRTICYAAPNAYGVPVGLGMLFSEGLTAEDHAVRVDVQMEDGSWLEYNSEVHSEMPQQHPQHQQTIQRAHLVPRKRRERRSTNAE